MSIKNGAIKVCVVCGIEKYRPLAKINRPTCGIKCAGVYRRRPMGLRKKEGYICKDGYRMVRHKKWYTKEHRLIFAKFIGRDLMKHEMIHHCDENKLNNDLSNLQLFRHSGAHKRLHLFATRHGLPVEALKFEQPWLTP